MSSTSWQRWWAQFLVHRVSIHQHLPKFLKVCPEPIRGEVLEVGAGEGITSKRILDTFPQVELTAIDISANAIQKLMLLQPHYGRRLKVFETSVEQLPFDRSVFDIVLAINVLGQFSGEELSLVLRELVRVARPDSLLGISESHLIHGRAAFFQDIDSVLKKEMCTILYHQGGHYEDWWVRLPHES